MDVRRLFYYFKIRRSPEGKKVLKQQKLWDNRHRTIEFEFKNRDQLIRAINRNTTDILDLALNRNSIAEIPNESALNRRARLIMHQNEIDLEIKRIEKLNMQFEEDARLFQNAVEGKTLEEGGGVLKGKNLRRVNKIKQIEERNFVC